MAEKSNKKDLREVAQNLLPEPIIVIGYLEHQLDLISQLVVDISAVIELPTEAKARVGELKKLLAYSSLDFNNLESPLESYKIPNAVALKQNTRKVQKQYLNAQIREGIFGEK